MPYLNSIESRCLFLDSSSISQPTRHPHNTILFEPRGDCLVKLKFFLLSLRIWQTLFSNFCDLILCRLPPSPACSPSFLVAVLPYINNPTTLRHNVRQEARQVSPLSYTDNESTRTNTLPDGRQERVQFDKITARVSRLCYGLDSQHVDPVKITQKVISGVYGGVTTIQLDDLVSNSRPACVLPCNIMLNSSPTRLLRLPHI